VSVSAAADQHPKALLLDGGGLGGGVAAEFGHGAPFGAGVSEPSSPFDHDHHSPGATKRARRLRKAMPLSEKKLWAALRKLDLGIRRQAPIGRYIADFAHHGASLVIEVDGRRHDLPEEQLKDVERDAWLQSQGYRVIRIRDDLAYGRPHDVAERIGQIILVRTGKMAAPTSVSPSDAADTPPSPALPPLRRKGES
jgi:very-short-patch-repair endonuclease